MLNLTALPENYEIPMMLNCMDDSGYVFTEPGGNEFKLLFSEHLGGCEDWDVKLPVDKIYYIKREKNVFSQRPLYLLSTPKECKKIINMRFGRDVADTENNVYKEACWINEKFKSLSKETEYTTGYGVVWNKWFLGMFYENKNQTKESLDNIDTRSLDWHDIIENYPDDL